MPETMIRNKQIGPYHVVDLTPGRRLWLNALDLVLGGTAWKPAVAEGRIEPREILNLTVLFDYNVVDGPPAARFTHRLNGWL